jgi:hypothetical protein
VGCIIVTSGALPEHTYTASIRITCALCIDFNVGRVFGI